MQARRDQNDIYVGLGVSSVDNITPLPLRVDPVTDFLLTENTSQSITATLASKVKIDENDRKTCYGVSSIDNVTLIPIRTDYQGRLLIQWH
jgi:hypothetical protein